MLANAAHACTKDAYRIYQSGLQHHSVGAMDMRHQGHLTTVALSKAVEQQWRQQRFVRVSGTKYTSRLSENVTADHVSALHAPRDVGQLPVAAIASAPLGHGAVHSQWSVEVQVKVQAALQQVQIRTTDTDWRAK